MNKNKYTTYIQQPLPYVPPVYREFCNELKGWNELLESNLEQENVGHLDNADSER